MKRNWRSVAERADNGSFGVDQISTAMFPALAGDCQDELKPGLIDRVRGMIEEQESLLIKDDIGGRIAALRAEAGAGIGQRFLDNVARISAKDVPGMIDLMTAMTAALAERAPDAADRSKSTISEKLTRKQCAGADGTGHVARGTPRSRSPNPETRQ
jgi:hypothetical protein